MLVCPVLKKKNNCFLPYTIQIKSIFFLACSLGMESLCLLSKQKANPIICFIFVTSYKVQKNADHEAKQIYSGIYALSSA